MKTNNKLVEFDDSFGTDGIVTVIPPGNFRNELSGLALDNNKRLIIYGRYQRETPIADQMGVGRIEDDGQIDSDFGDNQDGFTVVPPDETTRSADGVGFKKNGDFFVTGSSSYNLPLLSYNSDGKFLSFANVDPIPQQTLSRLVMTDDDKVIVVGGAAEGVVLYRRNSDGSQDNGFGEQGKKSVLTGNRYIGTRSTTTDKENARFYLSGESGNDGFIARFSIKGDPDKSFASEGLYTIKSNSSGTVNCHEIVLLENGAILAAVNSAGIDGLSCYVICLNAEGKLDSFFNRGQPIRLPGEIVEGLALAKDGRFVVTHRSTTEGNKVSAYLPNGLPDPNFGERGTLPLTLDNGLLTLIKKVIVQPDGKLVISALSGSGTVLIRLIP